MARRETILVFDSGLGGLTVHREIAAARPAADFVYLADDAAFPYGAMPENALVARVAGLIGELIGAHRPDIVVIACNTASTIALPELRRRFSTPFVGTVPAIKPLAPPRSRDASRCSAPRPRSRANIPAR
jgi:glutamate racemase